MGEDEAVMSSDWLSYTYNYDQDSHISSFYSKIIIEQLIQRHHYYVDVLRIFFQQVISSINISTND